MKNDLLDNINKLHTTELGIVRIQRNIGLSGTDTVQWCKNFIQRPECKIKRQGKNWYACNADITITVNAHSFTIITAHRK
ncbi:MAG TPA: DUF3781 domain-containing protein [Treponemataceae bacterium]|jgi:hypothetical protein|nr:DUF3781 domain-containing protein [Treponemataceae bacterium]